MNYLRRREASPGTARSAAPWLALLAVVAWSWGLAVAVTTTLEATQSPDPFANIQTYEVLQPHLAGVTVAGFMVERPERKQLHKQLYRAQYAVAPTVLLPVYTPKAATQWLRKDSHNYLVVSARPHFIQFVGRRARTLGYRFELVRPGLALISPAEGKSAGAD